jgi:hypothetical protein
MKSLLLLLTLTIVPILSFSQSKNETEKKVYPLAIYTNPEFNGGTEALEKYVSQNFKVNRKDKKLNTKGEIIVKFYICVDGNIKKASVLNKGLSVKLNNEALRVISEMPKWKPAKKNGVLVEAMYAYTFHIK